MLGSVHPHYADLLDQAWNTSLPAWTLYNKPSPHLRLAIIYNALAPVYLLLSHSWEILFLANFAVVLGLWLQMAALSPGSTSLQRTDVKRALQFLFLVHAVTKTVFTTS